MTLATPTINGTTRGRALSFLVHADTKVGKSTLAATCPKPMLLLDAESAYRFLDLRKIFWNPLIDPPPLYDGTWEVCVVLIRDYSTLSRAVEWLVTGNHHFRSVAIDSVSEVQKKFKDQLTQGEQMDQRRWGALLDEMEKLCRMFRDMTEHPTTPLEAVVFTAMTEQRDGKWRPYVQGALRVTMPYFLDVIGFMDILDVPSADPTLAPVRYRRMIVAKNQVYETGERVGGKLGDVVYNPNVQDMINAVFGPLVVPQLIEEVPVAVDAGSASASAAAAATA